MGVKDLVSLVTAGLTEVGVIELSDNGVIVRFSEGHILIDVVENCCSLGFKVCRSEEHTSELQSR